MKLLGVFVGELIGVIGSASVTIGKIRHCDWAGFVGEGKRFVTEWAGPQNPAAYGLTSSILVPGTSYPLSTYDADIARPPRVYPPPTGNLSGNYPPDPYADSKIFVAWKVAC